MKRSSRPSRSVVCWQFAKKNFHNSVNVLLLFGVLTILCILKMMNNGSIQYAKTPQHISTPKLSTSSVEHPFHGNEGIINKGVAKQHKKLNEDEVKEVKIIHGKDKNKENDNLEDDAEKNKGDVRKHKGTNKVKDSSTNNHVANKGIEDDGIKEKIVHVEREAIELVKDNELKDDVVKATKSSTKSKHKKETHQKAKVALATGDKLADNHKSKEKDGKVQQHSESEIEQEEDEEEEEQEEEDEAYAKLTKEELSSMNIDPPKPYNLGPKITNWDEQRQSWLNAHNYSTPSQNILLVSGSSPARCVDPFGAHLMVKAVKNKIDYCRIHGIPIFYNLAHLDSDLSGFWSKLPLLRALMLAHPGVEWLWWMDSDAIFTDMTFELPMERYQQHNLVVHGWEDEVYKKKSWFGLNTGSLLIRNCQWSLDLLDAWAPMGPKGNVRKEAGKLLAKSLENRPVFEADDQGALVYLLISEREKWGDKIFFESSFCLHGFWVPIVETFEDVMKKSHPGYGDDRWPFITHFVGCKPCGRVKSSYPRHKCSSQMERTFNFGDNQILQQYGFQHKHLGTPNVTRVIPNETYFKPILGSIN